MDKKKKSNIKNLTTDPFKEYLKVKNPSKEEKVYAWQTAIGLQDVDGLSVSKYLLSVAKENIEGIINLNEAKKRIDSYYEEATHHKLEATKESDKVSVRITKILGENSFVFSPSQYISIHRRLFQGVYKHAGKVRKYDILKKEWILNGASIIYGGKKELMETLEYDFKVEKEFCYKNLTKNKMITHLARFIANLWQIHIFEEGNTRTTAVFLIKYLKFLGFNVTNDIFAKNAWYFRNALVRANYKDASKGIFEDLSFLELFLRNLILNEKNVLKNRYLHLNWKNKDNKKQHIKQHNKQHIENGKIEDLKGKSRASGNKKLQNTLEKNMISDKTSKNILKLYNEFQNKKIFSRKDIIAILNITQRPASTLIKKMYLLKLIDKVHGAGKGKYKFYKLN